MPRDRFLNPFTDFGFKRLFGEELSKPSLIDFLNELLPKEQSPIKELKFGNTEHWGRHRADRRAIFDLYCQGQDGQHFIVELQKAKQKWFKDRSLFYASFPIQEQAPQGDWDFQLQPVYTIGILDFVFDEDKNEKDKYLYHIKLTDIETKKVFYEKLTFVYLEAPKFTKTFDQLTTRFEKWVYFIKHLTELEELPPGVEDDAVFSHFFKQAELENLGPKERAHYEDSLKIYRDLKNVTDTAFEEGELKGRKKGRAEGIKEGIKEGRQEGIKEGIKEGIRKGRKKGKEEGLREGEEKGLQQGLEKTALKMISKGFKNEEIAELTGLSIEDLETFRKNR